MKISTSLLLILLLTIAPLSFVQGITLLIFSKTNGYRHPSITNGLQMFDRLAASNNWNITATENSSVFDSVPNYDVIVFLQSTGNDLLTQTQQESLMSYMAGGKGFIGIHAATDAEYTWDWYGSHLIGANFQNHPNIQQATIHVSNHTIMDPVVEALNGSTWVRTDEWYNFDRNPRHNTNLTNIRILATLDESTYSGGSMGSDHPIIWCHESNGGREFYTGLGHTEESYTEPAFEAHIESAVNWVSYQFNDTTPPDTDTDPEEGVASIHVSSVSMSVFVILYCLYMSM